MMQARTKILETVLVKTIKATREMEKTLQLRGMNEHLSIVKHSIKVVQGPSPALRDYRLN